MIAEDSDKDPSQPDNLNNIATALINAITTGPEDGTSSLKVLMLANIDISR